MGEQGVVMAIGARAQGAAARHGSTVLATQKRSMATLKQTELRIKSTANISKITKAMQMVAAAKLRTAEQRVKSSRPLMEMIKEMSAKFEDVPAKKTTFIPITTDRGLCGGVNVNLCKQVANVMIPESEAAGDQEADKYSIVYNRFVSAMSQIPSRVDVLSGSALAGLENSPLEHYELEKAKEEFNGNLAEFNLATAIFAGMVDNQCSEIASKMAAMDNATRNCDSLVEKLQIQYNKARQAKITTELIEIISGAEPLKG